MHPSDPTNPASRSILKLKSAPRNREALSDSPHDISSAALSPSLPRPVASNPPPRPQSKLAQKPNAAWSDEFTRRMQEDMDILARR